MRKNEGPVGPRDPGWYPDPWSPDGTGERYFDGTAWLPNVKHLGDQSGKRARRKRLRKERRRARLDASRNAVPTVLFAVVLGAIAWVYPRYQRSQEETARITMPASEEQASNRPTTAAQRRPPPSKEEAAEPLGAPAPVPEGIGGFEVRLHQEEDPSTPVAFDPCRPVHFVVNPQNAPADAMEMILRAVARVQTATGLEFVYDGETDEKPDKQRAPYQPRRYGEDRWAPVLMAWSDEVEFPVLSGYVLGAAGPHAEYTDDLDLVYVTGSVVFDGRDLAIEAWPDRDVARAAILHELGHLVGLDHTSDRTQLMFSESQFNVLDFGVGDLRGLAELGTQACYPDL